MTHKRQHLYTVLAIAQTMKFPLPRTSLNILHSLHNTFWFNPETLNCQGSPDFHARPTGSYVGQLSPTTRTSYLSLLPRWGYHPTFLNFWQLLHLFIIK